MRGTQVMIGAVAVVAAAALIGGVSFGLSDHTAPAPPYHELLAEDALRLRLKDPALIAQGRQLFLQNCTLCHGVQGQGLVGPNLRDDFWINGSDAKRIVESIANGNPAKGMAPWHVAFGAEKIHALAAHVVSLHGTDDGHGKAAEGTKQPITW